MADPNSVYSQRDDIKKPRVCYNPGVLFLGRVVTIVFSCGRSVSQVLPDICFQGKGLQKGDEDGSPHSLICVCFWRRAEAIYIPLQKNRTCIVKWKYLPFRTGSFNFIRKGGDGIG